MPLTAERITKSDLMIRPHELCECCFPWPCNSIRLIVQVKHSLVWVKHIVGWILSNTSNLGSTLNRYNLYAQVCIVILLPTILGFHPATEIV